jgi:hypothetical protein
MMTGNNRVLSKKAEPIQTPAFSRVVDSDFNDANASVDAPLPSHKHPSLHLPAQVATLWEANSPVRRESPMISLNLSSVHSARIQSMLAFSLAVLKLGNAQEDQPIQWTPSSFRRH